MPSLRQRSSLGIELALKHERDQSFWGGGWGLPVKNGPCCPSHVALRGQSHGALPHDQFLVMETRGRFGPLVFELAFGSKDGRTEEELPVKCTTGSA